MPWYGPPARAEGPIPATKNRTSKPWDVHRAGQIGREQLAAITQLHESFARSLTLALGTYLRVVFAAALVSGRASHLPRVYRAHSRKPTYLAACNWIPWAVRGALQPWI